MSETERAQAQDSLTSQLWRVARLADDAGEYDAADWIRKAARAVGVTQPSDARAETADERFRRMADSFFGEMNNPERGRGVDRNRALAEALRDLLIESDCAIDHSGGQWERARDALAAAAPDLLLAEWR